MLEVMVVVVGMVVVDADLVQKGQHAEAASFKETDDFTAMNPCVKVFFTFGKIFSSLLQTLFIPVVGIIDVCPFDGFADVFLLFCPEGPVRDHLL